MAYFTPEEEAWALQVTCPICEAEPQSPCDRSLVDFDGYHMSRINAGKEVEKSMALKNKRSSRSRSVSSFNPDEWDRKRKEWDAELDELRQTTGAYPLGETTSSNPRSSGKKQSWQSSLPPPKPWEWWETGLPGVFAGRQPLYAKDAEALVKETGITHILDLREPKEWKAPWLGEAPIARLIGAGIVRKNVPMVDASRMTEKKLDEAVAFIEEVVKSGGKAYVHCKAGKERTGTVLFTYAVRSGITPESAFTRLQGHCKEFRPMRGQMETAFSLLKLEGCLPCYDCGRPLSVSPEVGMCRCLACSKHFKTTSYIRVASQGTAVGTERDDCPPAEYCWNCKINFAATDEGICLACETECFQK